MSTREQAMTALLAKLAGAYAFGVVARRNPRDPATVAAPGGPPALILWQHEEDTEVRAINQPPKRTITAVAVVYLTLAPDDENTVIDTIFNAIAGAVDAALSQDNPATGTCTLGGAVVSARIDGKSVRDSSGETGLGFMVIPIAIILP
jgi:hypothetical protein